MLRLGEVALRRAAPVALLLGLAALPSVCACTTNHDALARQPPSGGGGGGGVGGGGSFGAGGFGNGGTQPQGGRMNPDDEPPGDDVLTVVNGVVDASSVQLCFARLDEEGNAKLVGAPLPELPYAHSTVLTELAELSFAEDVVQPWVLAGDLSLIEDLDCADAVDAALAAEAEVTAGQGDGGAAGASGDDGRPSPVAEKPTLRARGLAALPAGTVTIGRSILLALSGCLGGPGYDDAAPSVCGDDFAPGAPTAQPVVVKLSRALEFDKVALQGVNAAVAVGSANLRVSGDSGATALVFASALSFGEVAPRPADTRFSPNDLGVNSEDFGLQATDESGEVLSQAAWPELLAAAQLAPLAAGRTYTAVLLGPRPRRLPGGSWNEPAFAVVDNDPTRQ